VIIGIWGGKMDVFEAISQRRSIRKFKDEDVDDAMILQIIQGGIWAPSAGNLQSWEIVLVKNPETKKKLCEAAYLRDFISKAPIILVVCVNQNVSGDIYNKRGVELYGIQDAACATQNMLLMAHAIGLGACWVGAFNEELVADLIDLPPYLRPVALVTLGVPDEKPYPPPRRDIDEFLHREKY
jgi:nitroreductase